MGANFMSEVNSDQIFACVIEYNDVMFWGEFSNLLMYIIKIYNQLIVYVSKFDDDFSEIVYEYINKYEYEANSRKYI